MSKTISDMEGQRRELDRQIRAAKRAEAKAATAALLSARQDLGVWLTETAGADTIDSVERLRRVLDSEQIRTHLREQIRTSPANDSQASAVRSSLAASATSATSPRSTSAGHAHPPSTSQSVVGGSNE